MPILKSGSVNFLYGGSISGLLLGSKSGEYLVGINTNTKEQSFTIAPGLGAMAGIEYRLKQKPLLVSLDIRTMLYKANNLPNDKNLLSIGSGGISVGYIIN